MWEWIKKHWWPNGGVGTFIRIITLGIYKPKDRRDK